MKQFFTTSEEQWLEDVTPDFPSGGSEQATNEWRQTLLEKWFARFAYRHPRRYRHVDRPDDRLAQPITGRQWKEMWERMRNRLNNTRKNMRKKAKQKETGIDARINTEISDHIERMRSEDAARELYQGEAYFSVDPESPYSISSADAEATSTIAVRMDAWPSVDFAGCLERDRREIQLDLPDDMTDICRSLAQHSGAEFLMVGAWQNEQGDYQYYQATSPRATHFLSHSRHGSTEGVLGPFLQYMSTYHGPRLSPYVTTAAPAVYGALDGSFRPILPQQTLHWHAMTRLAVNYFQYLWEWQGGLEEVDWESNVFVESRRLPEGVAQFRHPNLWDEPETHTWTAWLHRGQTGGLDDSQVFQFALPFGQPSSRMIREMSVDSPLRYGPDSRLFVARLLLNRPEDIVAQAEIDSQFPRPTRTTAIHPIFSESFLLELRTVFAYDERLVRFIDLLVMYEGPHCIRAAKAHWTAIQAGYPELSGIQPDRQGDIEHFIGHWWVSQVFFSEAEVEAFCSSPGLSRWIRSNVFRHPLTGSLFAGPYGVKWAVLALLRAEWSLREMGRRDGARPSYGTRKVTSNQRTRLTEDIRWLFNEIRESARKSFHAVEQLQSLDAYPPPSVSDFTQANILTVGTGEEEEEHWEDIAIPNKAGTRAKSMSRPVRQPQTRRRVAFNSPPKRAVRVEVSIPVRGHRVRDVDDDCSSGRVTTASAHSNSDEERERSADSQRGPEDDDSDARELGNQMSEAMRLSRDSERQSLVEQQRRLRSTPGASGSSRSAKRPGRQESLTSVATTATNRAAAEGRPKKRARTSAGGKGKQAAKDTDDESGED